eukprot:TRINITY_DN10019_c0_g1_i1.p1 TRINITY_DN10019_c0_g1~~TRINITY_DN10019_c0_g1_i1.p1  ORF type:complete len:384 (+),score=20.59 TRINITY_DN10019_c0_g1_i1:28-1179(+)
MRTIAAIVCFLMASVCGQTCGTRRIVMSDNDDTIFCQGSVQRADGNLAGIDEQWTLNLLSGFVAYPGIGQFLTELSRGPNDATPEPVILNSARPRELCTLSLCIDTTDEKFTDVMAGTGGSWSSTVLYGQAADQACPSTTCRYENLGETKARNQAEFRANNTGEYDYIWVGDNGQGDVKAAVDMLSSADSCVKAAFINDVVNSPARDDVDSDDILAVDTSAYSNIYFYRNTAHAAMMAKDNNFISLAGMRRILDAIRRTKQYQDCSTTCSCACPFCCSADGCQADDSGVAPGCKTLQPDVVAAEAQYANLVANANNNQGSTTSTTTGSTTGLSAGGGGNGAVTPIPPAVVTPLPPQVVIPSDGAIALSCMWPLFVLALATLLL